jgi:hypothetical protein
MSQRDVTGGSRVVLNVSELLTNYMILHSLHSPCSGNVNAFTDLLSLCSVSCSYAHPAVNTEIKNIVFVNGFIQ